MAKETPDKPETPSLTVQQLAVENAKLRQELDAMRAVVARLEQQLRLTGITDDIREEVQAKMRAGLSQQDAIDVVRRQRAHDAEQKATAGKSPVNAQ